MFIGVVLTGGFEVFVVFISVVLIGGVSAISIKFPVEHFLTIITTSLSEAENNSIRYSVSSKVIISFGFARLLRDIWFVAIIKSILEP